MDSSPVAPNPEGEMGEFMPHVPPAPAEGKSFEFGPILRALLPFILGGGSVFSVVQWAITGPQERRINELKAQQIVLDNKARELQNQNNGRKNSEEADESKLKRDHETIAMQAEVIKELRDSLAKQKANGRDPEAVALEIAFRQRLAATAGFTIPEVKVQFAISQVQAISQDKARIPGMDRK